MKLNDRRNEGLKFLRACLLVFCGFNIIVGLGLTACGSWMHESNDVHAYITVFVRSTNDESLVAAAALIVSAGVILVVTSLLGLFAVLKRRSKLLSLYMWLLFCVFVMGIVAGFLTVALYYNIHKQVKNGMQSQLNKYYDWESPIGKAWNRVQVKKRCCGVDGTWDYENTAWYARKNPIDAPVQTVVPDSCCALSSVEDTRLYWVDPQKPQLKDALRCQQDAVGRINKSPNVHMKGCFAALFRKNPDLKHDVSIFTVMAAIEGLGLSAGFLQLFGIGLTYLFVSRLRPLE